MSFQNNKFWFWGFILLLILNISAISSIGYFSYKIHNGESFHSFGHSQNRHMKNNKKEFGRWGEMNFTKEQRLFVRQQRIEHRENMVEFRGIQSETHNLLFNEISKQSADTVLINEYEKIIMKSHKNMIDESIRFYKQLKTELSEDQIHMINKHISKRFHKRHKSRR